jgi:hypothetical protein
MMVPSRRGFEIAEEKGNVNAPLLKMSLRGLGVLHACSNLQYKPVWQSMNPQCIDKNVHDVHGML